MNKKIINIINDDIYTILEFEDHTILPLISVKNFINDLIDTNINTNSKKECIYCHRSNDKIKLCTLNDKDYICLECTTKIIEYFSQLGEVINLNLKKFDKNIIKRLKEFISGSVNAKNANFIVSSPRKKDNNQLEQDTKSLTKKENAFVKQDQVDTKSLTKKENTFVKQDCISIKANEINKQAKAIHTGASAFVKE